MEENSLSYTHWPEEATDTAKCGPRISDDDYAHARRCVNAHEGLVEALRDICTITETLQGCTLTNAIERMHVIERSARAALAIAKWGLVKQGLPPLPSGDS